MWTKEGRVFSGFGRGIQGVFEGIRMSLRVFSVTATKKNVCFAKQNRRQSGFESLKCKINNKSIFTGEVCGYMGKEQRNNTSVAGWF